METKFRSFIFSEDVEAIVLGGVKHTPININYIIRIGDKFYRVLDENPSAGCHRPFLFQERYDSGKVVQGYKFDAQKITNKKTLSLLNRNQIPYLWLNTKNVEEV